MVSGSMPGKAVFNSKIKPTKITATAPVAPDIMPGLPPKMEVTNANIKAAYKPVSGEKPGIKAKAIASGTRANATVNPESISVL